MTSSSTSAERRRLAASLKRVRRPLDEEQETTWEELFFDLVFVFVVTQLSALLFHHLNLEGAAQTLFLLLVAWWAWIYTTWMTTWFDPAAPVVRAVLLVGMLAGMFGAIAIPGAFGSRALLLVVGYVGLQTFRNVFMVLATDPGDPLHAPLVRIAVWNAWVGAIWFAGALLHDGARVAVWLAALVLDYAGPYAGHWSPRHGRSSPAEWELEPAHFTERIALFVIIALGESIVAAGLTASTLSQTPGRMTALVVAFLITGTLWWLYFDYHAARTLEALRATPDRGRLGRELSYSHIPLVAGIIVTAVANELVIRNPGAEAHGFALAALAAGPMLYLLGSVLLKRRVIGLGAGQRVIATLLVLGVALVGTVLPRLATWALMLVILMALAAVESTQRRVAEPGV